MADNITVTQEQNVIVVTIEQGPPGIQGPAGPAGSTVASGVTVTPYKTVTATNMQTAIEQLADTVFQQSSTPTGNVQEGDLWMNTNTNVLSVYTEGVWEAVVLQPDLSSATLNGGYF